jgi:hypothetical protein
MSHSNRRALDRGTKVRASQCLGRAARRRGHSQLLPMVPGNPHRSGPIDAQALAAEIAQLVARAKRGWCT